VNCSLLFAWARLKPVALGVDTVRKFSLGSGFLCHIKLVLILPGLSVLDATEQPLPPPAGNWLFFLRDHSTMRFPLILQPASTIFSPRSLIEDCLSILESCRVWDPRTPVPFFGQFEDGSRSLDYSFPLLNFSPLGECLVGLPSSC